MSFWTWLFGRSEKAPPVEIEVTTELVQRYKTRSERKITPSKEEKAEEIRPHQKRVFSTRDFSVHVVGESHYQPHARRC